MTMIDRLKAKLARYPYLAVLLFAAVIAVCMLATAGNVLDILQRRDAVIAASSILERLEARRPPPQAATADVGVPRGSSFVEGPSASVAAAALLQRLTGAIRRLRGNILSSQVDLQGPQTKAGFLMASASFELEQAALQPLLYDLEAGMPFVFVEQLVVQAPQGVSEGGKLKGTISVSGKWQGGK
ncbi:general secretion pathway protein GspM [Rhodopseudomonas palustris]|uniref:General secretion pathway protein GspM n=1 Tax=Rhodopseudomonas palustris TaxID=1076 RepID=A0A323UMR9_RHOPL|nr:type II secretion system protein GspM [Rhodopseudomonas palustris]PZA13631.1 general secretion pathway protein GspM [Rhodopseudomonas palustris]